MHKTTGRAFVVFAVRQCASEVKPGDVDRLVVWSHDSILMVGLHDWLNILGVHREVMMPAQAENDMVVRQWIWPACL